MDRSLLAVGAASLVALGVAVVLAAPGMPDDAWPDIRGTWSGPVRMHPAEGRPVGTDATLVIERQDGDLLWATLDAGGAGTGDRRLAGSLSGEGRALVLSGPAGTWLGILDGDRLRLDPTGPGAEGAPGALTGTLMRR